MNAALFALGLLFCWFAASVFAFLLFRLILDRNSRR